MNNMKSFGLRKTKKVRKVVKVKSKFKKGQNQLDSKNSMNKSKDNNLIRAGCVDRAISESRELKPLT